MAAVRDYALQFPNEGGTEMMSVLKAEADINVANRPDGDALESKGKQWTPTENQWESMESNGNQLIAIDLH